MDAPRLSALTIRLAAAVEFEPVALVDANDLVVDARDAFLEHVCAQADRAGALRGVKLERFLTALATDITDYEFGEAAVECPSLIESRDRLARRLTRGCGNCRDHEPQVAAQHLVCRTAGDPQHKACIAEVLALAAIAQARSTAVHRKFVEDMPSSAIEFAFARARAEESRGLYQFFSASGWTELLDDGRVRVGLAVRDKAFNRDALCQVLYILAHELTCHAFQGVLGDPRPNVADERCSWSEGWMDALAWSLTEAWIEEQGAVFPEGLRTWDLKHRGMQLHLRRYELPQPGVMNSVHMKRRSEARSAFFELEKELNENLAQSADASPATQFSIILNVAPIGSTQRERLITMLRRGLLQDMPVRRDRVVDACSDFIAHRDVGELEADLEHALYGVVDT